MQAVTSKGQTPASNGVDDICTAIENIETSTGTSLINCGTYSSNGSLNVTNYGISDPVASKFIMVPASSNYNQNSAISTGVTTGPYFRIYYGYTKPSFSLSGNTLTYTLPAIKNSMLGGDQNSNTYVNKSLGAPVFRLKCTRYYPV